MAVEMENVRKIKQLMLDVLDKCSVRAEEAVIDEACRKYIEKIQNILRNPAIQKWNELWDVERKLQNDARNSELYTKRGKILMDLSEQNYQKAVSDYLYAIFLDPNFFNPYSELIQIAAQRKDYAQARWFAEEACRRFPQNGNSFGCRAYAKCQEGDYLEAIKDCDIAISLLENRWFYNTRGRCYLKRGLFQEALVDFWKAHKIDPQYSPAIDNIKLTVEKIGYAEMLKAVAENKNEALKNGRKDDHFEKALMYLQCLEVFAPLGEDVLRQYGGLYYDLGQYEDALAYWKKTLKVCNNCWNNYLCAVALDCQGKYAQAREYYKIAMEFPDCEYRRRAERRLAEI